jgi:hypothetical protein
MEISTTPRFRCPRCGSTDIFGREENQYKDGARTAWEAIKFIYLKCNQCGDEEEATTEEERYDDLKERWSNPAYGEGVTWDDLRRDLHERNAEHDQVERKEHAFWPQRHRKRSSREFRAKQLAKVAVGDEFRSRELFERVVAWPDDDEPRREYARFARAAGGRDQVEFIEAQLAVADALRGRESGEVIEQLRRAVPALDFAGRTYFGWGIRTLESDQIVADFEFQRGFVEHVTMSARDFLDHADEVFSCAPIRYLTLTHVEDLMTQVMATEHIARIRALALPGSVERGPLGKPPYTIKTNALADRDLEAIAASPRLAKLTYLDVRGNPDLTPKGFRALALSSGLPMLSFVGGMTIEVAREIESGVGYRPWLHPAELYGTVEPDAEQVVESPSATWPEIAAKGRAR